MKYGFNLVVIKKHFKKFIDTYINIITPIVCGVCMYIMFTTLNDYVNPIVENNRRLEQENFELKVFVQSCKCKECKLTLKSVRSLYSHNELDSLVFNQN